MGYYIDRDGDTLWLADGEGVGWFALLIILLLPLFVAGLIISSLAVWITEHLIAAGGIFLLINFAVSFWLSAKSRNLRVLFMKLAANMVLFQTIFFSAILYGIPYIIHGDSLWDIFELLIVEAVNIGAVILINAISKLHNKAVVTLITALLAGILYVILMNHLLKGIITPEELRKIYHINEGWVFNLCFGVFFIM